MITQNLPRCGRSEATPQCFESMAAHGPDNNPPRILIADDVPGILEIMVTVLNRAGYRATGVNDGVMAWEALCADKFDLLITDHEMPRLSGLDLLRKIRASPFSLPSILMSGCIPYEESDLVELTNPGMIMAKPFSFPELVLNVGSLLSQSASRAGSRDGQLSEHQFAHQPLEAKKEIR